MHLDDSSTHFRSWYAKHYKEFAQLSINVPTNLTKWLDGHCWSLIIKVQKALKFVVQSTWWILYLQFNVQCTRPILTQQYYAFSLVKQCWKLVRKLYPSSRDFFKVTLYLEPYIHFNRNISVLTSNNFYKCPTKTVLKTKITDNIFRKILQFWSTQNYLFNYFQKQ